MMGLGHDLDARLAGLAFEREHLAQRDLVAAPLRRTGATAYLCLGKSPYVSRASSVISGTLVSAFETG